MPNAIQRQRAAEGAENRSALQNLDMFPPPDAALSSAFRVRPKKANTVFAASKTAVRPLYTTPDQLV